MKLTKTFETFAQQVKNTFSGWKIEFSAGWQRTYEVFLTPSIRYNDWSAVRLRQGADGEFEEYAEVSHYALTAAFLTCHASVALTKDTPIVIEQE